MTLEAILSRPPDAVYAEAYRVLHDYEDARDAVAEAVALAWEHAGDYRGEASISTWFYQIAQNCARSQSRRRMIAEYWRPDVARRAPVVRTPESRMIAGERQRRVWRAVRALPPSYRAAVQVVYYDGLTIAAAARRLGISRAACTSRIHRVKRILRERMGA